MLGLQRLCHHPQHLFIGTNEFIGPRQDQARGAAAIGPLVQKLQGRPEIRVLQHEIQRPLLGLAILKGRQALEIIAQMLAR